MIDVLATSKMDLVRTLIGLPPYAVHRWRTAMTTVMATLFFRSAGRAQRQKLEIELNQSAPVGLIIGCHSNLMLKMYFAECFV